MNNKLYYQPPIDTQFDEVKAKAIEIWNTYDNTYGYVDEKVNRIKDMKNVSDNFMVMVAMFDYINQNKLSYILSKETRKAVCDRIRSGGSPDSYNMFGNYPLTTGRI